MVPNLSLLHARCSICCIVLSRILLSVMLPPRYPTSDSDHVHHAPLSGNATGAGGIWEDPTWSDLYRFIGHSHPVDLFARCSNKQRSIHKSGAWGKECCRYCILCRNQKVNFHTHSQLFNKSLQVREITNFSKELNGSPHNVSWLMGENPLSGLRVLLPLPRHFNKLYQSNKKANVGQPLAEGSGTQTKPQMYS